MEYASKAVGTAGLSLGIIGTSLGALAGAGGLAGLLGVRPGPGGDPGDRPVTRYEMGLITENTQLKAQQYTDARANGLQAQLIRKLLLRISAIFSDLCYHFSDVYHGGPLLSTICYHTSTELSTKCNIKT